MIVFLNGRFLPEEQAMVSVFDRSFLYGDGLFETIPLHNGKPFRWAQHLERLERGAAFLRIPLPFRTSELKKFAGKLVENNQSPNALLRLQLSRGVGVRGYSPQGANRPALVMTLHPAPALDPERPLQWRLISSTLRLPAGDPLAAFKTCNKLPHILARAEAEASGADEALLLNTNGEAAEAASGNLFRIENDRVGTPPLTHGVLPGVTRAAVLEICRESGIDAVETGITPGALRQAQGVFLSLSSWGIIEIVSLDGHDLGRSPLTEQIRKSYQQLVERECSKQD